MMTVTAIGRLGMDREPLVDGLPWRSREVGELVDATVGPGARVERVDGPERFDILPLLVCTTGRCRCSAATSDACAPI